MGRFLAPFGKKEGAFQFRTFTNTVKNQLVFQIIRQKKMQKEQEDSKGSQFKLSNITDAIVDVEKRNKTLDDALAEATQKLEQKSSQINKLLRDEAELAIKRSKIKREIDLFETAHKDEMSSRAELLFQEIHKVSEILGDLRVEERKQLIMLEYFESKKRSGSYNAEMKYLKMIESIDNGPLGAETAQLADEINSLKLKLEENHEEQPSVADEIEDLKTKSNFMKTHGNSLENESVRKNDQRSILAIEVDRLKTSTKVLENRLKANQIRLEKFLES